MYVDRSPSAYCLIDTLAVLHYDDQLIVHSEKLLVAHQEWHSVLLDLVIQPLQYCNLLSLDLYLSVSSFDVLFGHSLQKHLLGDEVTRFLTFLAIVEPDLVNLA